jgi:hypothetical protein
VEEQVEKPADGSVGEPLPKRNAGRFRPGDPRINREGRPLGSSKAASEQGTPLADLAPQADRLMRLFVPARQIACYLSGREAPWVANLPKDFKFVASRFDPGRDGFFLTLRSETFPRVAQGAPVPEFVPKEGTPSADLAPCADRVQWLVLPREALAFRISHQNGPWIVNLPQDATILTCLVNASKEVLLLTRSATFPLVAKDAKIPKFEPEWNGLKWLRK